MIPNHARNERKKQVSTVTNVAHDLRASAAVRDTTEPSTEMPFYLGVPISRRDPAIPITKMQQTTCQVQQSNGIWVTVIDD